MGELVDRLVSIMHDLVVCAVRLNWDCFNRNLDRLEGWAEDLWDYIRDEIVRRVNAVWDWLNDFVDSINSWIDYLLERIDDAQEYAQALFHQVTDWVYDRLDDVKDWVWDRIGDVSDWVNDLATDIYNWAAAQINYALDYAWSAVQDVWDFVNGTIMSWLDWLSPLRNTIDWLVHTAYTRLAQFFGDPLGFILGLFKSTLVNWLTVFGHAGNLLTAFIYEQLPDVYGFWAAYAHVIKTFAADPRAYVEDLLADTVLDWLAGLAADNW